MTCPTPPCLSTYKSRGRKGVKSVGVLVTGTPPATPAVSKARCCVGGEWDSSNTYSGGVCGYVGGDISGSGLSTPFTDVCDMVDAEVTTPAGASESTIWFNNWWPGAE